MQCQVQRWPPKSTKPAWSAAYNRANRNTAAARPEMVKRFEQRVMANADSRYWSLGLPPLLCSWKILARPSRWYKNKKRRVESPYCCRLLLFHSRHFERHSKCCPSIKWNLYANENPLWRVSWDNRVVFSLISLHQFFLPWIASPARTKASQNPRIFQ